MDYIRFVVICHINSCANLWPITSSLQNFMCQQIKADIFWCDNSSEEAIWANKISGHILQSISNYLVLSLMDFYFSLEISNIHSLNQQTSHSLLWMCQQLNWILFILQLDELKNRQLITNIPFLFLILDWCSYIHDVIDGYLFHFCK